MKLKLNRIILTAFKGATAEIEFGDEVTNIYGANRSGKTRVFDAITYLLFGKNNEDLEATGRSPFEIRPIINKILQHKVDVEVEGHFLIDNQPLQLMKVFKEKWTKKRGEAEAILTGSELSHHIDLMDVSKSDFDSKINEIASFEMFKTLSNPLYFHSLDWKVRRKMLMSLVPAISDEEIAAENHDFKILIDEIRGKNIDDFKKTLGTMRRKLSEALKTIPARIDEVTKGKPESKDFADIRKAIGLKNQDLEELNRIIADESKGLKSISDKRIKIQTKINALKDNRFDLEYTIKLETNKTPNNLKQKIQSVKNVIDNLPKEAVLNNEIIRLTDLIVGKNKTLDLLRDQAIENGKSVFILDESKTFVCPTCKQDLPQEDIDLQISNLKSNFNTNKAELSKSLKFQGEQLKKETSDLYLKLQNTKKQIAENSNLLDINQKELERLEKELASIVAIDINEIINGNTEIKEIDLQINTLIKSMPEAPETSEENKIKKSELETEIKNLEKELDAEQKIKDADKRIEELENELRQKAQEIADIEKKEFTIEQFTKAKIDKIEGPINSKFKFCQFNLYRFLLNGGGEEICETTIDGVPYNTANHESRINAGLEVINVLSEHHNLYVPIIIDNRDLVTDIIPIKSQLINLIVSPEDNKLRIEKY